MLRNSIAGHTNAGGSDAFLQIKTERRVELTVKGSRFIASAGKVADEEAVQAFLDKIRAEFPDASHQCYAWRLGFGRKLRYRYSDDGEPPSTAGLQIYKVLDGRNYSNTIVVVTRYFGGVKLGTGGLIRAYGKVTQDLLRECGAEKSFPTDRVSFKTGLEFVSLVHNIVAGFKATILESNFSQDAAFIVELRASRMKEFRTKLKDATNGQVIFEK